MGLRPVVPQNAAGMRMDPPPSVPIASGAMPLATDAAAPPLEPPAVRLGSRGFRVSPHNSLLVTPGQNSGLLVFPTMIAPASTSRATHAQSSAAAKPASEREPLVAGRPRTQM